MQQPPTFSSSLLEQSRLWLKRERRHHSHNSSTWGFLAQWKKDKKELLSSLLQGSYEFSPMKVFVHRGALRSMWEASDALVQKALSLILEKKLPQFTKKHCYHLKDNKGLKAAVRSAHNKAQEYKYVLKVDVKSYYQSLDHETLYQLCKKYCAEQSVLKLLWRAIKRVDLNGGIYTECQQGIPTGSSLSNIFGAIYLSSVDKHFSQRKGVYYIRYMDDIIIMTNSSYQLRRSLKSIYALMSQLKISIHRNNEKFYIGKIEHGFDFLGYRINKTKYLSLTKKTLQNHFAKLRALYEQRSSQQKIAQYRKRFWTWVSGGLAGTKVLDQDGVCPMSRALLWQFPAAGGAAGLW